ncbi:Pyridoxine-5'-phosphate oxidase-like [Oopsacas minuta]|uniref:Pyridoxine-5'-phosphate oxidase n=1 Tax=Oopsacas minuta TaxID=111878 RepID=A0AAV7K909_9METZ|nr:Pyridoxine-5'-phosphate oxidase-like [Oopsacas minuta]
MCADKSSSISIDPSQKRLQYDTPILNNVDKNPFIQFQQWYEKASSVSEIEEPNAMCVSTCNKEGKPSSRMVLMKKFTERGITFYSNQESRKGGEMTYNSNVALLFYWTALKQQIRIEGRVERVPDTEADDYWSTRPMMSRITTVVSQQSRPVSSREELERKIEEVKEREGDGVKRPSHWIGYLVVPDTFEFWQGHSGRLHDRFQYKSIGGDWDITRLQP